MKVITIFLAIICACSISGCFLLRTNNQIQYFTLNKVANSCIKSVKLSGPAYLLSENIMLKKGTHQIGTLNNAYWITSLQTLLPGNISSSSGEKDLHLKVAELALDVLADQLIFSATAKICRYNNCQNKTINYSEPISDNQPIAIVEAFQLTFEKLVSELCV